MDREILVEIFNKICERKKIVLQTIESCETVTSYNLHERKLTNAKLELLQNEHKFLNDIQIDVVGLMWRITNG
jgi:hypothetical protein